MRTRSTTFVRVLAITGGAFLVGTGHALISDPISLAPKNINAGTENVKGAGPRVSDQEVGDDADAGGDAPAIEPDASPEDPTPEDAVSETDAASVDPLDAPVPEGMLTLRESYTLWEQGAYFIDSRLEHEYAASHIEYADWLVSSHFDTDVERVLEITGAIPPDGTVVLYCVGGECDASKNTAARLEGFGYTDLRIMGAGFSDWEAAGLPVESPGGTP